MSKYKRKVHESNRFMIIVLILPPTPLDSFSRQKFTAAPKLGNVPHAGCTPTPYKVADAMYHSTQ